VEDTRLRLQLVSFIVWTKELHENLHAVVNLERAPILAGQIRAGLRAVQGVEKSQSHFVWRDEMLCAAHPDLDCSSKGLKCLILSMASVGGDFRRLSTASVEPFFFLFFVLSILFFQ